MADARQAPSTENVGSSNSLDDWLSDSSRSARKRGHRDAPAVGLRFAFYGRIFTADYQDRRSSRQWQRDCAAGLIAGHGPIVAEFFDVGVSRRRDWSDRPQAARLLAAIADPDRDFDAIVVGEYERHSAAGNSPS